MIPTSSWKSKLARLARPDAHRADRLIPPDLLARHEEDPASKPDHVKDISATGLYLETDEHWPPGELVNLKLQRAGMPEGNSEFQISIQAKVARLGEDGIGLMLVPPEGVDENLWGVLLRNAVFLTEHKEVLKTFRMIRAILFLCRLCPDNSEEAIVVLGGELNAFRTENAFEIASRAEEMISAEPDAGRLHVHPHVVAEILRSGSWEGEDVTQALWAGMLVSSRTTGKPDESSLPFVELLVQVTPVQARVLVAACKKAREIMSEREEVPSQAILCTPEEIIQITDMYDISRVGMNVAYLYNFGLLKEVFDFTSYVPTELFDITPTKLGLDLCRLCRAS